MPMKTIKPGTKLERTFSVNRDGIDEETRTAELSFSSEQPYERWWGIEILDHGKKSVRLDRLKGGGPLLMDHDARDHVGVIESVAIDDKMGRAVVRFGRGARADEVFQDVLDGIRRNVSVGYVIHKAVLESTDEDKETYRVSDWEPFEVSLVSVPADTSVGVGRSAEEPDPTVIINREHEMPDQIKPVATGGEPGAPDADAIEKRGRESGVKAEQQRVSTILELGEKYVCQEDAREFVQAGKSVRDFKDHLIEFMANKPVESAGVGMSERDAHQFSFLRALNALANPGDRRVQEAAAFEREASDAMADKLGRAAQGFFVPPEVQRRDLTVGTATAGGHTVSTDLLAESFIEMLRNRMMVVQMGGQVLSGLTGNIAIPRQTGGATAYWVAESGAPTESAQAFDQVTMSPNTAGAFVDISRKLMLQSSLDVEAFVRGDLARVLALAIDQAAINGSGASNQPTGILNTTGIGAVIGGANGLAPTWAHIVELWSDVAAANADFGSTGFLTNSKVAGKLMTTEKASGTAQFVCPGFPGSDGMTTFGGGRAGLSNQVPSNLTKGTGTDLSAILFGNFADLIIGEWGTLDLTVDPYSNSTSGTVRVVALQDVDVAVRHAESFSAMTDAITA